MLKNIPVRNVTCNKLYIDIIHNISHYSHIRKTSENIANILTL